MRTVRNMSPSLGDRLSTAIATGLGVGYVPKAPGTAASLVAMGLWYWWYPTHGIQWIGCATLIPLGIWAAGRFEKRLGRHDPSQAVIDEVAGMWLALAALPRSLGVACAAFLLFRVLDIFKPPPIRQAGQVPGGVGIMLDDVVAGLIVRVGLGLALAVLAR